MVYHQNNQFTSQLFVSFTKESKWELVFTNQNAIIDKSKTMAYSENVMSVNKVENCQDSFIMSTQL